MRKLRYSVVFAMIGTITFAQNTRRWQLFPDGGICMGVKKGDAHSDLIEISGSQMSNIIRFGMDENRELFTKKKLIFPMLAMAAALTGNTRVAVEMLLHDNFRFDEHGLANGGPFPYFPSNRAQLTAVVMLTAGWDDSESHVPGFSEDGDWNVRYENFNRIP